jgi:hypothetical protein
MTEGVGYAPVIICKNINLLLSPVNGFTIILFEIKLFLISSYLFGNVAYDRKISLHWSPV